MLDMRKPISQYSEEDFSDAAEFVKKLPRDKQKVIVEKLIERLHAKKNAFAHVNWSRINKFEFNGIILAGNVSGR